MTKSFYRTALCTSSALVAAAAFAVPAMAQVSPATICDPDDLECLNAQGEDAFADEEVITITGSRIARPDLDAAVPVTVVGAEEIATTGTTRVEDLMNNLPQVFAGQTAFIANGASGTATVNLRGLGSNRTLVLVNGRRLQPGSPEVVAPDINQIPGALIERIEVTTGGASAVYGADAVSGVVNFIMDTTFEGFRADAQVSFYQHENDRTGIQQLLRESNNISPDGNAVEGFTYDFNVAVGAGTDDGRGHVMGYAGYREIDPVLQADYDYSACALDFDPGSATGYGCTGSSTTPNGTFFVTSPGPEGLPGSNVLTLDESGPGDTFRPSLAFSGTGADTFNYAPTNFFQRPGKRYTAGFFAEYEVTPSFIPFTEFMFMNNRTDAQIAFSGTFYANDGTLRCDNPFLSEQQRDSLGCADAGSGVDPDDNTVGVLIGKRLVEGTPRNSDIELTSYRGVVGAEGEITENWRYILFGQYGTSRQASTYENDLSIDRVNQALNATRNEDGEIVCRDPSNGCVPLNLFEIGGVTRDQFEFLAVPALERGNVEEWIVSGYVAGDLFSIGDASPIGLVVGSEYRREELEYQPDLLFETGGLTGQGGTSPPVDGDFDVVEGFAEIRIPLLQDLPFVEDLTAEGAYRYSDYSTAGGEHTYTGKLEYQPFSAVRFRGSYARAVRAPNILELFSPQQTALFGGSDPCAGATPNASLAQCQNTGVTAAQYGNIPVNAANQYNQVTGGNPDLEVEKADTYTGGVVIEGSGFLPGFVATVDYFNISVEDTISTPGAQNTINSCIQTGNPVFCDLIIRNAGTGDLFLGSDTNDGFVFNGVTNIGGLKTEGIDGRFSYRQPVGPGSAFLEYTGTYLFDLQVQDNPDVPFYDCAGLYGNTCGGPNPEYRHRFRVGYDAETGFGLSLRWRYFGGVENDQQSGENPDAFGEPLAFETPDDDIDAFNWFDVAAYIDIGEQLRFTVGVNNVLDADPPIIGSSFAGGFSNGNTYPGEYDPLGRDIFVRLGLDF